ncbi:MAG: very short patch repair endonuclease [Rheinheimera sp.]|uniref:very short patch repair endonuclease n=1 Tax=Arsukibacterium sp. UBA3155 TaxID=1946058 RepID=UPI000C93D374|nr:very short patch repair endonuclease [Arsukibacterium sp. UBA3155]MAD75697.1 very short patch repair endonuclease [Rheinheimera sp.]
MVDVHDKETRSKNMAAIRNKNTRPELMLRKQLHAAGFRYRLNVKEMPGKPDIVLPKYKTVIFVHGCFWHLHNCLLFKWPSTRAEWWKVKLMTNRQRDLEAQDKLMELGWRVLVVWECEIKSQKLMDLVSGFLLSGELYYEIP